MKTDFRYARFHVFRSLLGLFSKQTRQQRMAQLQRLLKLKPGMRVLDLGGQPGIWDFVTTPMDVTILNLPGVALSPLPHSIHRFRFVEGDACM